jgi:hypothetical protein
MGSTVRTVLLGASLALVTACAQATSSPDAPAGPLDVKGTITNIVVSDHPTGICDPQSEYTDVEITFRQAGADDEQKAAVTPAQIVATDPCTKVGSFELALDPDVTYKVCVNETTHDPGAMDVVGTGACGITVEPPMLQDGRLDITFDSRKARSKQYSTYS